MRSTVDPSALQSLIAAGVPLSNGAIARTLGSSGVAPRGAPARGRLLRGPQLRAPLLEPGIGYDGMWQLYADEVIDRSLTPDQVKAVKDYRAWMEAGFTPGQGYARGTWAKEAGVRAAAFAGNARLRASLYAELQRQMVQAAGGPASKWYVSVERGADGSYIFRGDPTLPNQRIFVVDPQGNCYAGGAAEGFASRGAGKTVNYAKLRPIGAAPAATQPRVGLRAPVTAAPSGGMIRASVGVILPMLALELVFWWIRRRVAEAERQWLEQLVATKLDPAVTADLIDQADTIDRLTAADPSHPLYANITADFDSEWTTTGIAKARSGSEHVTDVRFAHVTFSGQERKDERLIETTEVTSSKVVATRRITYSLLVFHPEFEAEKVRRRTSLDELMERYPGMRLDPSGEAARALDPQRWVDAASQIQAWFGSREVADWRGMIDTARQEKAESKRSVRR